MLSPCDFFHAFLLTPTVVPQYTYVLPVYARQPQLLQQSIKSELAGWSLGKFSRMNFWRRGHRFGETPKTTSIMKYTGEDILQNGILDVESRLGEGGMGQVFLARNKEDGTTVAVKVGKDVRNETNRTVDRSSTV